MYKILIFLLLGLSAAKAQQLSGYIVEAGSGEAIIGAIAIDSLANNFATSNEYGYFSIKSSGRLKIQAMGYEIAFFEMANIVKDSVYRFYLNLETRPEVVVSAEKSFLAQSRVELSMKQLERIPAMGSEKDILKAITLFPGISNANEGSAQLIVRGGGADQNLILLDGTVVYNSAHFAGFISVFNADAVKKIEMYKGGFPASYGGRLSSVLNISMKEGNNQKWGGNFGIGIVSSRLLIEGPLWKDKISVMLSGRLAYLGLFTLLRKPAFERGAINDNVMYNFFDINTKINYNINSKQQLFISFYSGRDNSTVLSRYGSVNSGTDTYYTTDRTSFDWGNRTATIRHNWLLNAKLFLKTQLSYTRYDYHFSSEGRSFNPIDSAYQTRSFSTRSLIADYIAKSQVEYSLSAAHSFKAGFEFFHHKYQPYFNQISSEDSTLQYDTLGNIYRARVPEGAVFIEGLWRYKSIEFNYGLRWSGAIAEGKLYQLPEPRFSFLVKISREWALRAAFTRMGQYIHLLANNGVGFPNDIWVPITKQVPPQKALQYSAGAIWQGEKGWRLELEGFYKSMSGLIDYKYIGGSFLGVEAPWEAQIAKGGKGTAYGMELLLQKQLGKLVAQLAYTLSWNQRQFPDIQNNSPFPFKYDRRHQINTFISWQFHKNWDLSAIWVYSSGFALTVPVARVQGATTIEDVLVYGDRNNARMPDFHRLDLGLHYKKTGKKGRTGTWSLDIYNAYNRQNPFALLFRQQVAYSNGKFVATGYQFYQLSLFPIIPSISYALQF